VFRHKYDNASVPILVGVYQLNRGRTGVRPHGLVKRFLELFGEAFSQVVEDLFRICATVDVMQRSRPFSCGFEKP
jgi:hypothetical protein